MCVLGLPSKCYHVRSWVASLPCAFLGSHPHATVCVLGLPPTSHHPTSHIPHHPHATVCVRGLPPAPPTRPPTQPATHPTSTSHNPIPPMPSTCYRAHSWVASALSWLGPLWHWVVCGIGQLHPVHPCFTAQLLCAVLLRSQDRNRLRTPGKHHLIIHHHLCRESQIPAADLSKNSSNKYQGDFGSYRQRTLPRRLCAQDSPSNALRDLSH